MASNGISFKDNNLLSLRVDEIVSIVTTFPTKKGSVKSWF